MSRHVFRPAASLVVIFLCHGMFTTPAAGQVKVAQLRGVVRTHQKEPVRAAEIAVLATALTALTDSAGRFAIRDIPPGEYLVQVRRIGFRAQNLSATLSAGENKDVKIVLIAGAVELPEVTVTARSAKPIEYANTAKFDEFFRRRSVGLGRYISRRDIDRKATSRTASLLLGLPGVMVKLRAPGSPTEVWFRGCTQISVWVDGWMLRPQARFPHEVGELLDRIHPLNIEMIEVYDSPAVMPAEFLGDSCAAIAIWTR